MKVSVECPIENTQFTELLESLEEMTKNGKKSIRKISVVGLKNKEFEFNGDLTIQTFSKLAEIYKELFLKQETKFSTLVDKYSKECLLNSETSTNKLIEKGLLLRREATLPVSYADKLDQIANKLSLSNREALTILAVSKLAEIEV